MDRSAALREANRTLVTNALLHDVTVLAFVLISWGRGSKVLNKALRRVIAGATKFSAHADPLGVAPFVSRHSTLV